MNGMRTAATVICICLLSFSSIRAAGPVFETEIAPLLKVRCVKCHGPSKQAGKLDLSTPAKILRGGESGAAVAPHDLAASRLWERVDQNEMPPDDPLSPAERQKLKDWIIAGAPGLKAERRTANADEHWSFRRLNAGAKQFPPDVKDRLLIASSIDQFIQSRLESAGLSLSPLASRTTLARRVSLVLTGMPPSAEELEEFLQDGSVDAYERFVERLLAQPTFGEHWGKYWLDATGYADSNGYFNADTDRPLAYRYRDYVIRAFNQDMPFQQFLREQLAGDELAGFVAGNEATDEQIELLEATHFLRNGQDGTGESDGNPDEVRVDRYTALESCLQNIAASMLGLTLQCAKCHDHKFEPITQADYYRMQAVFYPAFPAAHADLWIKPKDRVVMAPRIGETEIWNARKTQLEEQLAKARDEFTAWAKQNRVRGDTLFEDTFDDSTTLAARWSTTAPGDDVPSGAVPVNLDSTNAPAARIHRKQLEIIEGSTQGDSWISTKQSFDWTPDAPGAAIQATFDLVDHRIGPDGTQAQRIGYLIATHDFNDNSAVDNGNLLIDGNPGGATTVYFDYPGTDGNRTVPIGGTGYVPGCNYGVRITNTGNGKFKLEHLVDGVPDGQSATLSAKDLPDGGFSFEYCCGRSFIVDNVLVEALTAATKKENPERAKFEEQLADRRKELERLSRQTEQHAQQRPGRIAWASDVTPQPPAVHLLTRGNYAQPGEVVEPAGLSALSMGAKLKVAQQKESQTTGRRLAWVNWLVADDSSAASLVARVQVNRLWQGCFGSGLVSTPENLGLSGAPPSHPDLLDSLAARFVASGWSTKAVLREIVLSHTFRQTSDASPTALDRDSGNRLWSRYPVRRLDAEAIRDSLLAVSGTLNSSVGGAYVPTSRDGAGEVVVDEANGGSKRRSIYLQQRRTQVLTMLQVFDAPSIVFNRTRRSRTTMPLQSLSLLNAKFLTNRATDLAARITSRTSDDVARIEDLYRTCFSRLPTADEVDAARDFIAEQSSILGTSETTTQRAWIDLCHSLLISNEFLYVD